MAELESRERPSRRSEQPPGKRAASTQLSIAPAITALSLLLLCAACDEPNSAPPAEERPLARGRMLYESYCSDCHGPMARGDGPRASTLDPRPKDLTLIGERNGNLFIDDAVAGYIDGRKIVEAHGPREMPVWGREFDDRNEGMEDEMRLTPDMISTIVQYIRTLQRKP